jgi:hypothetical protein
VASPNEDSALSSPLQIVDVGSLRCAGRSLRLPAPELLVTQFLESLPVAVSEKQEPIEHLMLHRCPDQCKRRRIPASGHRIQRAVEVIREVATAVGERVVVHPNGAARWSLQTISESAKVVQRLPARMQKIRVLLVEWELAGSGGNASHGMSL